MGFWRRNMPAGMVLRSANDWYLDPHDELTIERFFAETGRRAADVEPLDLSTYLAYIDWFAERLDLDTEQLRVGRLSVEPDGVFRAEVSTPGSAGADDVVRADAVVLAVGQRTFAYAPPELTALLPAGRWTHTCDLVDFSPLRGKRCVIDVVHRHPAPAFAVADWDWATALAGGLVDDPAWWRSLSAEERMDVTTRLWGEGRLKVEPWLEPRLQGGQHAVHAGRRLVGSHEQPDGTIVVGLDDGTRLVADHVVLATGYRPDAATVPVLADLLPRLAQTDGHLDLDEGFQTSIPGLFATGALAAGAFGPFFGFTLSARSAGAVLGAAVRRRLDASLSSPTR